MNSTKFQGEGFGSKLEHAFLEGLNACLADLATQREQGEGNISGIVKHFHIPYRFERDEIHLISLCPGGNSRKYEIPVET